MKVLFVNPVTRFTDAPKHVPLGILQLIAILERDHPKIKFQLYDANAHRVDNFRQGKMEGLQNVLQSNDYDVMAVGGLITSYNYVKIAAKTCREISKSTKIVVGGGVMSAIPSDIMTLIPQIDYGVIGEAYITFPELLNSIEKTGTAQNMKGIIKNRGGGFQFINEPRPLIPDLDWLPFPAYNYAPLDIYFKNSSILMSKESMESKRRLDACFSLGCPFLCKYCWDLGLTSGKYDVPERIKRPGKNTLHRRHSPKYIANYIAKLILDYKVDFVSWLDENVAAQDTLSGGTWLEGIDKALQEKGIKHNMVHMGGTSHSGLCTKKMLKTMKNIGFTYLDYGLESFSPEILMGLGKGITPELNKIAIRKCLDAGISPIPNQMIMFPEETWKSIHQMLDAWEETGIVSKPFICTPYPGSEWYEEYKNRILRQFEGNLDLFLSSLEDATSVTALLNNNFTPAEAAGIQQILMDAAKTQNFSHARRLLTRSEK